MKPLFITFEGLDGSGKSTHLRRAAGYLGEAGTRCLVTHEPGGTPFGDAVRSVFLDPQWTTVDGTVETLLVFATRRQHLLEVIDPTLAAGKHVLCDRFTDSTVAYQGYGRGVSLESIDQIDRVATDRRVPDRTILLDLPAEAARQRGQSASRRRVGRRVGGVDRLDSEELEFYTRVRQGFLDLAAREPERFRVISSEMERERTWEQVKRALADLVGK